MAGLTDAKSAALLDLGFPTTGASDWVAYSENGSTESSNLARTAVGATGWAAATVADPSVKANGVKLTTAATSGAATFTHFRIMSASTAGVAHTDWKALDAPKALGSGVTDEWAIGALKVTLT